MTVSDATALRPEDPWPPRAEDGARVIHGDPAQIAGRPWQQRLAGLILVLAAAVDVATFYQVLVLVMNVPEPMVWATVVGFTVVALTLAHYCGVQARQAANPRNPPAAKPTAWLSFAIWLVLGLTAFAVRFLVEQSLGSAQSEFIVEGAPPPGPDSTTQQLSALLFLVLYVATGLISGLAGFLRPDPAATQYRRALKRRTRAAEIHANSTSRLAEAQQVWNAIDRERKRREDAWLTAQTQCIAAAERLKQEARLWLRRDRGFGPPPPPPSSAPLPTAAPPQAIPPFMQNTPVLPLPAITQTPSLWAEPRSDPPEAPPPETPPPPGPRAGLPETPPPPGPRAGLPETPPPPGPRAGPPETPPPPRDPA